VNGVNIVLRMFFLLIVFTAIGFADNMDNGGDLQQ
jgi:hypothetical protein